METAELAPSSPDDTITALLSALFGDDPLVPALPAAAADITNPRLHFSAGNHVTPPPSSVYSPTCAASEASTPQSSPWPPPAHAPHACASFPPACARDFTRGASCTSGSVLAPRPAAPTFADMLPTYAGRHPCDPIGRDQFLTASSPHYALGTHPILSMANVHQLALGNPNVTSKLAASARAQMTSATAPLVPTQPVPDYYFPGTAPQQMHPSFISGAHASQPTACMQRSLLRSGPEHLPDSHLVPVSAGMPTHAIPAALGMPECHDAIHQLVPTQTEQSVFPREGSFESTSVASPRDALADLAPMLTEDDHGKPTPAMPRGTRTRKEPKRADYQSQEDFDREWIHWRQLRDINNNAVKRSRMKKKYGGQPVRAPRRHSSQGNVHEEDCSSSSSSQDSSATATQHLHAELRKLRAAITAAREENRIVVDMLRARTSPTGSPQPTYTQAQAQVVPSTAPIGHSQIAPSAAAPAAMPGFPQQHIGPTHASSAGGVWMAPY
eukprot:m.229665 g.229665  ORF g.229665 m.229665 type:complete len:498 (+) comp11937_c0_seq1:44-1537(+)